MLVWPARHRTPHPRLLIVPGQAHRECTVRLATLSAGTCSYRWLPVRGLRLVHSPARRSVQGRHCYSTQLTTSPGIHQAAHADTTRPDTLSRYGTSPRGSPEPERKNQVGYPSGRESPHRAGGGASTPWPISHSSLAVRESAVCCGQGCSGATPRLGPLRSATRSGTQTPQIAVTIEPLFLCA